MVHKVVFYCSFLVLFFFSWCQPLLERLCSVGKMCILSGCLLLLHSGWLFLMGSLGADVVAIIISKILNGMWTLSFWRQICSLENLQVIIIFPPYKGRNLFGKLHKTCYASSLFFSLCVKCIIEKGVIFFFQIQAASGTKISFMRYFNEERF